MTEDHLEQLPTEDLEVELCGLAARVAAATCLFLRAVAEYDRRRAWEAWECHDMAGWLSWKCGISPVTAREHVRVARALDLLPLVRERFANGRLSYSQTRAIVRVATPHTEARLVELAEVSTAAQLETITRAYRRSRQAARQQEYRRDVGRFLRLGWDDEGNLVGQFQLPAEQGAILMNAVAALTDRAAVTDAHQDGAADPFSAAQADALVELLAAGHGSISGRDTEDPDSESGYLLKIIAEKSVLESNDSCDAGDAEPGLCHVDDGPGLASETARRIACDATTYTIIETSEGKILDVGRSSRRPNRALRRAVCRRDKHCRFPSCTRRAIHTHHIHHWIDGGNTSLSNLIGLCSRHHHRLHEGGYRIDLDDDGHPHFIHPAGYEIPAVVDTLVFGSDASDLLRDVADVEPYSANWDGSRVDLPTVVDCLLQEDGLLVPRTDDDDSAESPAEVPVIDDIWAMTSPRFGRDLART